MLGGDVLSWLCQLLTDAETSASLLLDEEEEEEEKEARDRPSQFRFDDMLRCGLHERECALNPMRLKRPMNCDAHTTIGPWWHSMLLCLFIYANVQLIVTEPQPAGPYAFNPASPDNPAA